MCAYNRAARFEAGAEAVHVGDELLFARALHRDVLVHEVLLREAQAVRGGEQRHQPLLLTLVVKDGDLRLLRRPELLPLQ